MIAVRQHGGEVGAHAGHAVAAQRLHPRLLHGIEHCAGNVTRRLDAPVDGRIMAGEAERHGVRMAAQHGGVMGAETARRLGQTHPVRTEMRPLGREGHIELGHPGNGLEAASDGPLEGSTGASLGMVFPTLLDGGAMARCPRFSGAALRFGAPAGAPPRSGERDVDRAFRQFLAEAALVEFRHQRAFQLIALVQEGDPQGEPISLKILAFSAQVMTVRGS